MQKVLDGNKACASVAYMFSEMSFIYPITPSSPMASEVDKLSNERQNIFNDSVKVIEMQSEAGAAGALHGALLAGSLASTYTSSQGLLLMIPNMYKMAGEMLPAVIHVAARSLATHALSIFGDHQDVYAARATGFCMLASASVEDAYNLAIVSHLAAIKGSLPFLHFFDGFRTSHEINKINLIEDAELLKLVPKSEINSFRKRMLNVDANIQKGMAENEDIYFQSTEARNSFYDEMPDIVNYYMTEINKLTGRDYKPFNYYGDSEAESIIVAMGSVSDTIKLVIDKENKSGKRVGLIEVHLYRPFSTKYLLNVLPTSVKKIAVLDRTKEAGSNGEPLYLDIVNALKETDIKIVGGRYGLSSKNTTPAAIKSVFDMLEKELKNNFTIGIKDDLTNLSLEELPYEIDLGTNEIKICGFGSDGMVSTSKSILEILGKCSYVQGYFEYDSKKSGGVTVANLRIGEKEIKAPYYVTNPNLVVITKFEYLNTYDMLDNIKNNGTFVLNTIYNENEIVSKLPNKVKKILKEKNINFYIIDADKISLECGIKGKISKIMETIILKFSNFPNVEEAIKESIRTIFKTKGEDIVNANIKAVDMALSNLKQVAIDFSFVEEVKLNESLFERIRNRKGDQLSVGQLQAFKEGTFPGELTKEEKRHITDIFPKWIPENCIQCGQCAIVCPHAVIRSFLLKEKDRGIPLLGNEEYNYFVSVSEADCTNCTLCYQICPGKAGNKAIRFDKYEQSKQEEANKLFNRNENPNVVDKFTIKGSQLEKPKFEFSGACAGCGETAYIKLLTQLYGDKIVIANATGCSSIYGGSAPSTPYSIPWANSLFEDNAEFGFGLNLAYKNLRSRIGEIMNHSLNSVTEDIKEAFNQWINNKEDFDITYKIKNDLLDKEIPNELKDLLDYVPARSVWTIGGDGWAYDIGFGGIDHVLSSNENVNILVLDTEVYSNTGGQASKSSRTGQVAEFADFGKKTIKKDLFKIAMGYPNCYVASISLGANIFQTIKVLKEAEEHTGPSIIIAYATCVEHGIKNGLTCSLATQKNVVDCGYTLLMRYNPKEDKLYLDSKEPDFNKYEELLNNETRYKALKIKDSELAVKLFEENKNNAIKRYEYYKELSKKGEQ